MSTVVETEDRTGYLESILSETFHTVKLLEEDHSCGYCGLWSNEELA